MFLILSILRLLLDLLVGSWRGSAPLAARRDGRLQTWQDDDATNAVADLAGFRLLFRPPAPPGAGRPPRRLSISGARDAAGE
jgi:hypothetical protein